MFAPAPISRRAAALLIDSIVVAVVTMVALVIGAGLTHAFSGQPGSSDGWLSVLYLVLTPLLWASINVMTVGRRGPHHGQTIGKQLLQLRTVDDTTQGQLSLRQLLSREVLGRTMLLASPGISLAVVSDAAAFVVLAVGMLVILRSDRRSGIDLACGTSVVDLRRTIDTDDDADGVGGEG